MHTTNGAGEKPASFFLHMKMMYGAARASFRKPSDILMEAFIILLYMPKMAFAIYA